MRPIDQTKFRLYNVLHNRKWERHEHPFPYVYAHGVFHSEFYKQLEDQFNGILAKGVSDVPAVGKFCRNMTGYDAYGTGLDANTTGPMTVFLTPEWHDVMAGLFPNVKGTGYVNAGLHHHKIGSKNGYIHNDLNPCWFPFDGTEGRIRFPDHGRCSYKAGEPMPGHYPLEPNQKIQVVRGVVMLYYLANGDWFEGYGGETGFFSDHRQPLDNWVRKIPPLDNSIVLYECTPKSYHAFLHNKRKPRNCAIMWVHRPIEEAEEIHGAENMEYWKDS